MFEQNTDIIQFWLLKEGGFPKESRRQVHMKWQVNFASRQLLLRTLLMSLIQSNRLETNEKNKAVTKI